MGISSSAPHRVIHPICANPRVGTGRANAPAMRPRDIVTISIPAGDDDFRAFVSRAGYVDVVLHVANDSSAAKPHFTLSTNPDPTTSAHLYSNRRPEIRSFLTISSLRSALQRFGVEVAELPVVPGSGRCFVQKKGAHPAALSSDARALKPTTYPRAVRP